MPFWSWKQWPSRSSEVAWDQELIHKNNYSGNRINPHWNMANSTKSEESDIGRLSALLNADCPRFTEPQGGLSAVSRRTVRDSSDLHRDTRIAPNFDSSIIRVLDQIHQPNFNQSISSSLGTRSPNYFHESMAQKNIGAPTLTLSNDEIQEQELEIWQNTERTLSGTTIRDTLIGALGSP